METNNSSQFVDTTIILNGTYSFPSLEINGEKSIEVQELKFDRLTNADLISENGILLEANNRGYFYVPVKDDGPLLNNNLLTPTDITLNQPDVINLEESPSLNVNPELPQDQPTPTIKRKGGWPKGKKRKQIEESKAPKAPTTGFLNEKRQMYKELRPELPFAEVTRILGSEWSNLATQEKQKYLKEAEADKRRYREELQAYLQSDDYKAHLKKKKLNKTETNSISEDTSTSLDLENIDAEDSEELYCKTCDQFFNSFHNKREHLYGKYHLQMVTGENKKSGIPGLAGNGLELDSDLLSGVLVSKTTERCKIDPTTKLIDLPDPVNVPKAIDTVLSATIERENEIHSLKISFDNLRETNDLLTKQLATLQAVKDSMEIALKNAKNTAGTMSAQVDNLKMIPTLFRVISF